jgi:uncharacterized protein YgbK (DUF1537 family)
VAPHYGWYGDDFTGASDTLATLARRGQRAFLFLRVPEERHLAGLGDLDAIGIAGAARTMTPDEMRAELAPIGAFFSSIGVRLLHYKCCSTFDSAPQRGNLAAAVEILRDYVERKSVAVIGGQPSLGRYCAFSNLFAAFGEAGEVHRLDRHPVMCRHPATPMNEADLRHHLARLGLPDVQAVDWLLLARGDDAVRAEWRRLTEETSAVLFDAFEARHLDTVGRLLRDEACRHPLLVVGASSVAQAYFEERAVMAPPTQDQEPKGPVLAFVGSLSSTTRGQMAAASSYHRLWISPEELVTSAQASDRIVNQAVAVLSGGRNLMLSTAPEQGDAALSAAADLAEASARLVDEILKRNPVRRLAVAGGDTSSRIIGQLGFWGLGYYGQISNGVAVSSARSDDGTRDNMIVMLKGGQMGHERLFETFLEGADRWPSA